MSLALEISVRRSRSVTAMLLSVYLLAAVGAAVTLAYLIRQSWPVAGSLVLAVGGLAIATAWLRSRSRLAVGRLDVDEGGRASWNGSGLPGALVVEPVRWYAGTLFVWIRIRTSARSAACYDLLLGRDCASDEQWRRLRTWLLWLERGGSS